MLSRALRRSCSKCLGRQLHTAARPRYYGLRYQSTSSSFSNASQCSTNHVVVANPQQGLSPILLQRAQILASEHAQLSKSQADDYSVETAKRIGEISPIASALKTYEETQSSILELESLLVDPSTDSELRELTHGEIDTLTASLPGLTTKLSTSLIPPHPFKSMPCLIEINPGAGGSEASLFAYSLLSMYRAFCTRNRWQHELKAYSADETVSSSTTGITNAILEVTYPGAYDVFRAEAGVHRVQRIPLTEKKGRTHTSAVSVLVLPSFPESAEDSKANYEDPSSDYYIPPQDVHTDTMRASGAGGQHVNKTNSAIRLTHLPTGIVVGMQESRSQMENRKNAWLVLRARLAQRRREEREEEMLNLRKKLMGGVVRSGREDKVRTYNFAQNRISDHRSGWNGSNVDGFLEANEDLDACMDSVRAWMDENEVRGLIADETAKQQEKNV
jgi:peptide chain release factor 1